MSKLKPEQNFNYDLIFFSVELREQDQEMCDKKFCMRGDKCLHEKTQIEINYAHLCRDPDKYTISCKNLERKKLIKRAICHFFSNFACKIEFSITHRIFLSKKFNFKCINFALICVLAFALFNEF